MCEKLTAEKDVVLAEYNKAKGGGKVRLERIFGLKTFQPNVMERIKSFEDVLGENGIKTADFKKQCEGLTDDEIAYRKAKLMCLAFNEGWVPNWDDSNEYKYWPYFDMRSSASGGFAFYGCARWYTLSLVGSRLCFKSKELAIHCGKLFEQEIYKPLLTLNQ